VRGVDKRRQERIENDVDSLRIDAFAHMGIAAPVPSADLLSPRDRLLRPTSLTSFFENSSKCRPRLRAKVRTEIRAKICAKEIRNDGRSN